MNIEELTQEIEYTFKLYTLDQIPARIDELQNLLDRNNWLVENLKNRALSGKKLRKDQYRMIRQSYRSIKRLSLIIRALKESYAYRTEA